MALTQAFKQTVRARVQRDGKYREAFTPTTPSLRDTPLRQEGSIGW
jgi:hypothetical protein